MYICVLIREMYKMEIAVALFSFINSKKNQNHHFIANNNNNSKNKNSHDKKYSLNDKTRWIIFQNVLFKHYEYKILTTFRFHYFHRIMGTKYRHHSTIPKISIWIPAFTTEKYLFHQNISVLFSRIRLCGYIFFFINVAMTTTKYGKNGIQVLEVCGCDSTVVVGVWVFGIMYENRSYHGETLTRIIHS